MVHDRLIDTVLDILGADLRPLRLVSIMPLVLAGIGFVALMKIPPGTTVHADLAVILKVAPAWVWAVLFLGIAGIRLAALLHPHHSYKGIKIVLPSTAMLLWVCMFASNFIGNPDSIFALLYLVPAIIETWILGRNIDELGSIKE